MTSPTVVTPRWHRRWLLHLALVHVGVTGTLVIASVASGAPFDVAFAVRALALLAGLWLLNLAARQGVIVDEVGLHQRRPTGSRELARWHELDRIEGEDGTIPVAVLRGGEVVRLLDVNHDTARVVAELQVQWQRYAA